MYHRAAHDWQVAATGNHDIQVGYISHRKLLIIHIGLNGKLTNGSGKQGGLLISGKRFDSNNLWLAGQVTCSFTQAPGPRPSSPKARRYPVQRILVAGKRFLYEANGIVYLNFFQFIAPLLQRV